MLDVLCECAHVLDPTWQAPGKRKQGFVDLTQENINKMFRVKERDERQRGLEAKTAEAQRYVDLLEGEYDVLLEKCVEYGKREKDQQELEACHVDLLTLRDAATGEILFMEDVFTGARAGFTYGERDGKQGYIAVAPANDGLDEVRELGWCLPQAKPSEALVAAEKQPKQTHDEAQMLPDGPAGKDATSTSKGYSMALLRLQRNAKRLAALPDDVQQVVTGDRVQALAFIKQHGGLEKWLASRKVSVSQSDVSVDSEAVEPMTKKQILDMYGDEEGERLMKEKRELGHVKTDKNITNGEVFLIFKDRSEVRSEMAKRTTITSKETADQKRGGTAHGGVDETQTAAAAAPAAQATGSTAALPEVQTNPNTKGDENKVQQRTTKKAKKEEATTPLERAEDLSNQILKKKNQSADYDTKLKTLSFSNDLRAQLAEYTARFESRSESCDAGS